MTSVEKLIRKIEKDLCIQGLQRENFRRRRAGMHQLAAGAWSWEIRYRSDGADLDKYIGSSYPVSAFLRKGIVTKSCDVSCTTAADEIEIVPDEG